MFTLQITFPVFWRSTSKCEHFFFIFHCFKSNGVIFNNKLLYRQQYVIFGAWPCERTGSCLLVSLFFHHFPVDHYVFTHCDIRKLNRLSSLKDSHEHEALCIIFVFMAHWTYVSLFMSVSVFDRTYFNYKAFVKVIMEQLVKKEGLYFPLEHMCFQRGHQYL